VSTYTLPIASDTAIVRDNNSYRTQEQIEKMIAYWTQELIASEKEHEREFARAAIHKWKAEMKYIRK
jgi:hypothetical protein